jgi:hypothetical protein
MEGREARNLAAEADHHEPEDYLSEAYARERITD